MPALWLRAAALPPEKLFRQTFHPRPGAQQPVGCAVFFPGQPRRCGGTGKNLARHLGRTAPDFINHRLALTAVRRLSQKGL